MHAPSTQQPAMHSRALGAEKREGDEQLRFASSRTMVPMDAFHSRSRPAGGVSGTARGGQHQVSGHVHTDERGLMMSELRLMELEAAESLVSPCRVW